MGRVGDGFFDAFWRRRLRHGFNHRDGDMEIDFVLPTRQVRQAISVNFPTLMIMRFILTFPLTVPSNHCDPLFFLRNLFGYWLFSGSGFFLARLSFGIVPKLIILSTLGAGDILTLQSNSGERLAALKRSISAGVGVS
jgi:hypothetical protein